MCKIHTSIPKLLDKKLYTPSITIKKGTIVLLKVKEFYSQILVGLVVSQAEASVSIIILEIPIFFARAAICADCLFREIIVSLIGFAIGLLGD